jgi:RNA polymerase sigma-70 factor (ECF subfamily)
MPPTENASRDEALMRQVAQGSAEALGLLHRRYARLIFALAAQTLDRAAAEDLVQEVFLVVWRHAARFDPERGTVRAWILQIAHFRLLNELRRRSRQPEVASDPDGLVLEGLAASGLGPPEAVSQQRRRAIIQAAVEELPLPQRQALSLAFLDDLTHEQVASELGLPLGTAKTRIRAGLQKLRGTLGAHWAALAALSLLIAFGIRSWSEHAMLARYDRALSMVTASDSVNLRLAPAAGTPDEARGTHARYRGRPGVTIAVVTFSRFPVAPAGQTYQAWVRHGTTWTSLGTMEPDADGSGRLIAESPALAASPDGIEVTLEPRAGSPAPSGRAIVAWTP